MGADTHHWVPPMGVRTHHWVPPMGVRTHHWVPLVGVAGCLEAVTWLLAAAEALVDPEDGEGHRLVEGLGAARARIEMQVVRVDTEHATRHK